jgi:hypothetical protein
MNGVYGVVLVLKIEQLNGSSKAGVSIIFPPKILLFMVFG